MACHRVTGGEAIDSLVGQSFPLGTDFRIEAAVDETPALVAFDPSQAVSFITSNCLSSPTFFARVSVPDAFGPEETFPLTHVSSLHFGATHFRTFEAAVAKGTSCIVTLGAPELKGIALEFKATTVTLRPSQSREAWLAESSLNLVLPLTLDPRYDWPLLTVRIRQGEAHVDAALLVSLREPHSRVFEELASSAGLRLAEDIVKPLPPEVRGYPWHTLHFAPGVGLNEGLIEREKGTPAHAVQGLVGLDVWKRLAVTYDVGSASLIIPQQVPSPAEDNPGLRRVLQLLRDELLHQVPAAEPEPTDPD